MEKEYIDLAWDLRYGIVRFQERVDAILVGDSDWAKNLEREGMDHSYVDGRISALRFVSDGLLELLKVHHRRVEKIRRGEGYESIY